MDILKHGILGLLLSCLLLACRQSKTRQSNVTHNETFSIIQQTNGNKPFCITLVDSTQALSQKFIERLKYGEWVCSTASYNMVDINLPQNKWYTKWLVPVSLPLTCVFTSDGHLVDLIPGAAKESFLYVQKALTDLQMTEYHYPNRFSMPKKKLITLFDRILDCNTG